MFSHGCNISVHSRGKCKAEVAAALQRAFSEGGEDNLWPKNLLFETLSYLAIYRSESVVKQ
jgi:hypothetical protein